ncbi:MAG: EI24 domain-containing protein [Formosimonas sp.]
MNEILTALKRASAMMFSPRIWALIGRPMLISLLFWGVAIALVWWLAGDSIVGWIHGLQFGHAADVSWWQRVVNWLIGVGSLMLLSLVFLLLVVVSSMFVISVFGMAHINAAVATRYFPDLAARQGVSMWRTMRHTIGWTLWFAFFWIVSTPAYLVAGLGALLQTGVIARFNQKIFVLDALANHADPLEYEHIAQQHNRNLFGLGLVVTLLGALPTFVWLGSVMGVVLIPLTALLSVLTFTALFTFCGLAFSCYCLQALHDKRVSSANTAQIRKV